MGSGVMVSKFWTQIPRGSPLDNNQSNILGWVDGLKREEPLLITIRSLNGLYTAITEAAYIQATHRHNPVNVSISACELWPTKPINWVSAILKSYDTTKSDEIEIDTDFSALC